MEKVIRNGKVAVLISGGFGGGWYSVNREHPEIIFHPVFVNMVENGRWKDITEELARHIIGAKISVYDPENLEIVWIDEGSVFCIESYDGAESIRTIENLNMTA